MWKHMTLTLHLHLFWHSRDQSVLLSLDSRWWRYLKQNPRLKKKVIKHFWRIKAALQYVRELVQIKSTSVTLKSHEGLERVPKKVYWELKVKQLEVEQVKKSRRAILIR
ncbi:Uncharacterised protein [Acinetobacter baumannii]|nr:Uncharacterised protein [Acinetobacter baumannii]